MFPPVAESCALAIFGGTGQFCGRRGGGLVGVVMPVQRHALLCLGIGQVSPGLLVAHWFELVFAISSGENFEVEFEVTVVAIEP